MKAESGTLKHDIFQSSRPSSYLLKGRPLPIKSDYRKKQDIPFPASNFSTSSSAWLASLGRLVRMTDADIVIGRSTPGSSSGTVAAGGVAVPSPGLEGLRREAEGEGEGEGEGILRIKKGVEI